MTYEDYPYCTDLENTFYDCVKNWSKKELIDLLIGEMSEEIMIEIIYA